MAILRIDHNAALLCGFFLFSLSGVAQSLNLSPQSPPSGTQTSAPMPTNAQPQSSAPDAQHSEAERELKQEEKQRMLGVVPDFTSVRSGQAVALSPGQKLRLALADGVDPYDFATSALDAGLEQKSNEFPEYGQGGRAMLSASLRPMEMTSMANFSARGFYLRCFIKTPATSGWVMADSADGLGTPCYQPCVAVAITASGSSVPRPSEAISPPEQSRTHTILPQTAALA